MNRMWTSGGTSFGYGDNLPPHRWPPPWALRGNEYAADGSYPMDIGLRVGSPFETCAATFPPQPRKRPSKLHSTN